MYIEDGILKSEDLIVRKDDYGYFELEEEKYINEYGEEKANYTYNNGDFAMPYATKEIYLADSIETLEQAEEIYKDITESYYKSKEFKESCLNKFIKQKETEG